MDAVSPQDVYARHLVSRRGYPLWTPEPSLSLPDVYRREGLKIGDVGVVVPEDGSFDVFFNICLPPTHALHRRRGVPDNFNPVVLESEDIAVFLEAESVGRVISTRSVGQIGEQASNENRRSARSGPLDYEFYLASKEGALLILPEGAERYYLRNQRSFLEEAIQHAVDWYNFAEGRLGRIISHDSLYLITGFYKSRSWSLASYQQDSGVGRAYAQFKAVEVGRGNVSSNYAWEVAPYTLDWRVGPPDQYYNGISNQSIFIQGFKIAVRSSILGAKRVKVKEDFPSVRPHRVTFYGSVRRSNNPKPSSSRSSAPAASTSGSTDAELQADIPEEEFDSDSSVHDDDADITIQHVPHVQNPFHPSDTINQYLLRSHPSAVIAITHDTQWTTLLERGLITPEELVEKDLLEELVWNMIPIPREGAVYLRDIACEDVAGSSAALIDEITTSAQEAGATLTEQHDQRNVVTGLLPRKIPSPLEVRPRDPYESRPPRADSSSGSVKPLKSILKGSEHAATSSSSKQRPPRTSPDFVPVTPRPPTLSLPTEGPRASQSPISVNTSPTTSAWPTKSILKGGDSTELHATAEQPSKLLKSILKGGDNTEPFDSYEIRDDKLSGKRTTHSHYTTLDVLPPGSRLVPMKPPAFSLNWMLLPYDPRRSMRLLRFDVAFPVDEIVFQHSGLRTKLSDTELDAPAADGFMTKMLMTFEHGPFSWEVDIKNGQGIRCRDVFESIYESFKEQLTSVEKRLIRDRRAVEEAFHLRCRLAPTHPKVEHSYGWRRVDVLLHQTIFLGLTQPKSGGDWVLNLGAPLRIPGPS